MQVKIRQKKCKICKETFQPFRTLQVCCSTGCAIQYAQSIRIKNDIKKASEQRKEHREAKVKAKTRGQWLKEAQSAFNAFIRERDRNEPCISCGRASAWQGQWHASHYYATSIRPNLRFNENNVHKACSVCNNYMHGNLTPYRERLIIKIGIDAVNVLDESRNPGKYTIQDLIEIKANYAKLKKELDNTMQN